MCVWEGLAVVEGEIAEGVGFDVGGRGGGHCCGCADD